MSGKIVFINQATGYLTIDVINEFAKEFEKVALVTGSVRVQDIKLSNNVNVNYIIRYNRGNNIKKAFSWLLGTFQIYLLLKLKFNGYEKFFFTIPPTAYLLASNLRSPFSVAIYDLYPEALKANGFSEWGWLYKWWVKKNKTIFTLAHKVYTLSENMKFQILNYSEKADVRVISNWSAFSGLIPIKKENNMLLKREGLLGKFIIQYSGNIGVTHNVETLVEVAGILKPYQDLVFQIIGRGERSVEIGQMIESRGLTNCRLLSFRKDEELYESLCAADLAVIILDDKAPDISVPSKAFNIMAAGLPVMAIASSDSAISEIIIRHEIGAAFEKDDISGMCEFIRELINNFSLRERLSENSHRASQSYTRANAKKYLEYYFENN